MKCFLTDLYTSCQFLRLPLRRWRTLGSTSPTSCNSDESSSLQMLLEAGLASCWSIWMLAICTSCWKIPWNYDVFISLVNTARVRMFECVLSMDVSPTFTKSIGRLVSPTWSQTKGHWTARGMPPSIHAQETHSLTDFSLLYICNCRPWDQKHIAQLSSNRMDAIWCSQSELSQSWKRCHINHCDVMPSWNSSDVVSGHTSEFTWPPSERFLKLPQITKQGWRDESWWIRSW